MGRLRFARVYAGRSEPGPYKIESSSRRTWRDKPASTNSARESAARRLAPGWGRTRWVGDVGGVLVDVFFADAAPAAAVAFH